MVGIEITMTKVDFISRIIGVPWVDRSSSFEAVDCWGLVMLYYKEVLSIELPTTQGFISGGDFSGCYDNQVVNWSLTDKVSEDGIVFTCYKGDIPTHVGLCIGGGKVLHSRGSVDNQGKVEIHSLKTIEKIYGKITLHKFNR